eukprot:XP_011680018.1 PREDICTED: uncharacterized protein LOC105445761 [Strongylocentrotus purpuratus]
MAFVERFSVLITLILVVHCGEHIVNGVISDVRLVGGPTSNKGTVEIRQDIGSWETTCGVNLGFNDVIVICRHLGFTGASRPIENTPYGQNSIPTTALNCIGDEDNLAGCTLFSNQMCSTAGAASCHGEGYLGCFVDALADRVFPGERLVADPDLTISHCIEYCNSLLTNNVYAGVENGEECFCGEASNDYTRHGVGSISKCRDPCSGDPTDSCGGQGYIAVFRIFQSTPPPTTVADTRHTQTSTPSTFPSSSGQLDVNTEIASTLAGGILLVFVTLYGIIITLMYLHLRRSNTALKKSVRDREGQELDPYTFLYTTTMEQPAYVDLTATRHGNRGHTNAIEGVELENQTIVEHPYTSLDATTMEQPAYEDLKATRHGNRGHTNAIEGVELENQTIVEHPYTSLDATTMEQPAYEDLKATRHGNRGHTNAIEGVEFENQTIVEHPYTSLDATTMEQPAYEDLKATRQGNRGHTNAIEGPVEFENQRIVEHPYTSLDATTMEQPAYDDTIAITREDRGQMNAIEGVDYENQKIVKSNLGVADENTEPDYMLPIE